MSYDRKYVEQSYQCVAMCSTVSRKHFKGSCDLYSDIAILGGK